MTENIKDMRADLEEMEDLLGQLPEAVREKLYYMALGAVQLRNAG